MPDQFNQGPVAGERRSDPNTGESRVWSGSRWESNPIGTVSPHEPGDYWGGFLKGGMQSLGDSKGKLTALGGLLGGMVGAPNIGAMGGMEVGNLAEKMGGGDNTLMGDAARVAGVGAAGYAGSKVMQGAGWLANKMGAGNAALSVASHLPIVGKYARLAQALGAGGEAPAEAAAATGANGLSEAEVASLTKQGYTPEFQSRIAASHAPKSAAPAPAPAAAPRPRLSRPVAPYTVGNDNPPVMPPVPPVAGARQVPMNLDSLSNEAAERIPIVNQAELPNIGGKTIMPNLSQTPSLKYGADVSTAGDWHSQPTVGAAEQNIRFNPQTGQSFAGDSAAGPLSGLKAAAPESEGLTKWIESGGTPDKWKALQADGAPDTSHGFGPNTVGAAEKAKFLPKTVDEAKGMSLAEQEAWEGYKRANPGVTDGMLNSWYTNQQMGADPNEGLDIDSMVQKLTDLLKRQ